MSYHPTCYQHYTESVNIQSSHCHFLHQSAAESHNICTKHTGGAEQCSIICQQPEWTKIDNKWSRNTGHQLCLYAQDNKCGEDEKVRSKRQILLVTKNNFNIKAWHFPTPGQRSAIAYAVINSPQFQLTPSTITASHSSLTAPCVRHMSCAEAVPATQHHGPLTPVLNHHITHMPDLHEPWWHSALKDKVELLWITHLSQKPATKYYT